MDEKKINKYQFIYDNYLNDKYNSNRTKECKIEICRAFCKEYEIKLPKPINTILFQ